MCKSEEDSGDVRVVLSHEGPSQIHNGFCRAVFLRDGTALFRQAKYLSQRTVISTISMQNGLRIHNKFTAASAGLFFLEAGLPVLLC
jgi:hypothetical protein